MKKLVKKPTIHQIFRIVDANINRCVEGIRVIEDLIRFYYKKKSLYLCLRSIRHSISKIFSPYYKNLISARQSSEDFGKLAKERKYLKIEEIAVSNLHRAQESIRVLEEMSKLLFIRKPMKIKRLRYHLYDVEKKLNRILHR